MKIHLGRRLSRTPGNIPKPRAEDVALFYMEVFRNDPSLLAPIKNLVNFTLGAPRLLTVESCFALAIASGLDGRLPVRGIAQTALSLHPSVQWKLGIVRERPDGSKERVTERRVDYLLTRMSAAFSPDSRNIDEVDGTWVDTDTGEVIDEHELAVYHDSIESIGNDILAALWTQMGIPASPTWAMDSEVVETHFAVKAYGGLKDVDKKWVADPDKAGAAGGRATTEELAAKHAEWREKQPLPRRKSKKARMRRTPAPVGPVAEGDFTRLDKNFPQVGADGRLRPTKDSGAATSYKGAGSSRKSSFPTGRDKHTVVASGHFPDGTHYPPLLRGFSVTLGGASRTAAGLSALKHVNRTGLPNDKRRVAQDRIYTGPDSDEYMLPAMALGWEVTKSLTEHQHQFSTWSAGVLLVDGFWFTTALPSKLRHLPMRRIGMNSKELRALELRYDKREDYAFRPYGTTAAGSIRLIGPAVPRKVEYNAQGQPVKVTGVLVACRNSPYFNLVKSRKTVTNCREGKPCGCSKTLTVRRDELPSSYEPVLFGTSKWARKYHRRNMVETQNSLEEYHYDIGRHSIQVRAEKWDLVHLFLVLNIWYRQVRTWLYREGAHAIDPDDLPNGAPAHPAVVAAVVARVIAIPPTAPGAARAAPET